ncbi:MAG: DUF2891 domain-containing protein [Prolixibacteraceae bacterium]|nr:DUF2891 domain-containing protein [Prolixibacteraceae bacterium]
MARINVLLVLVFLFMITKAPAQLPSSVIPPFNQETASKFSSLAFSCIGTEFPNKISHLLNSSEDVAPPSELHPAFYGCLDWHSSVHGHWLLVKTVQMFPDLPQREEIVAFLNKNLTPEKMEVEANYFKAENRTSYERPYGWAWLLKLASELANTDDPDEQKWFEALQPLTEVIKSNYYSYLPGLYYPIRRGVHENTAFGIALALDYAKAVGDKTFESFLKERARFYFLNDTNIPAIWEPEGDDFLSPSLVEADLMRRVLTREEFIHWFKNFMPEIPFSLTHPAVVAKRDDPKGVHLDGLNLSRAWCMFELAKVLPDDSKLHSDLWQAGYRHAAEALPNVLSDNYMGTHWLATFAVYMYLSLADVQQ